MVKLCQVKWTNSQEREKEEEKYKQQQLQRIKFSFLLRNVTKLTRFLFSIYNSFSFSQSKHSRNGCLLGKDVHFLPPANFCVYNSIEYEMIMSKTSEHAK